MVELADIFRLHGPASRARCGDRMPTSPLAALAAIAQCRTEALGGHVYQCAECGELEYSSHACKNRHCPKCQNNEAARWLEKHRELILPIPYFLVPFTLPEPLRPVARSPQQLMYNLVLPTSSAALQDLALAPQPLGGQLGMLGVRHTGTRDMASHPHVHSLVPAGALAREGSPWLSPRYENWLLPVRALSQRFRGKFREGITKAHLLDHVPAHVWPHAWVTHCQPAGTSHEVLTSLAPYIRRSALTNNRIARREEGHVTFRCKESRSAEWKHLTLPAEEFIRRFLQHGLPQGCIKVRYYGCLSPPCRKALPHLRELLAMSSCHGTAPHNRTTRHPAQPPPTTHPARPCPTCRGPLVLLRHLSRPPRAPP